MADLCGHLSNALHIGKSVTLPLPSMIFSIRMPSKYSASELPLLELVEVSKAVQKKEVSPVELTRACLNRIEQLNPKLNAFITVTDTSALEEARKAEAEIARGEWKGPLHGVPLAVKDLD